MAMFALPPLRSPNVAAAALATLVVASACTSGASSSAPSPSTMVTESTARGTAIAGWPMPGQATTTSFIPILASAENVVGHDRFLLTLVDRDNRPIASPDRHVTLRFYDLSADPASATTTVGAAFLWAIEGSRGFYVAYVDFPRAGEWGVEIGVTRAGGQPEAARVRFQVQEHGSAVDVGEKAPSVKTLTLADVGGDVKKLSTDTHPDPSFYRVSVAEALAKHVPFVLVFATPAFCQSRVCGPTLDLVKKVAATESGVTFINVEPYELAWKDESLQPVLDANGQLRPVPAVDAYGLLVEPWVFVVDRDGIVRGSFEAVVGADELTSVIDQVK